MEHYDEASDEKKKMFDKPKEKKKYDALKSDENTETKKPLKCWICAESHMVKNCPSRPKVATISQSNTKKDEPSVGMM